MGFRDHKSVRGYVKYSLDGIPYEESCGAKPSDIKSTVNSIKEAAKNRGETFRLIDSGQTTK